MYIYTCSEKRTLPNVVSLWTSKGGFMQWKRPVHHRDNKDMHVYMHTALQGYVVLCACVHVAYLDGQGIMADTFVG